MLRVQDGQLRVVVSRSEKGSQLINYPLLDDVGLNSQLDYTITDLGNGSMSFSAILQRSNSPDHRTRPAEVSRRDGPFPSWRLSTSQRLRRPQDGGRVIFHRLAQQSTNS